MKETELLTYLKKGELLLVGTYWSGAVEPIQMRSEERGGPRRTAYVVRQTVMTDKDPITVTEWLKDDADPMAWAAPAKKGQAVVVRVSSVEVKLGAKRISGVIEALV